MARMSVPRWSVYVVVAALIASLSFSLGSIYSAFGDSHDTTYYACLFAGSLSQVGTTPPANCGRGSEISWNSEGVQGPTGATNVVVRMDGPHTVPAGVAADIGTGCAGEEVATGGGYEAFSSDVQVYRSSPQTSGFDDVPIGWTVGYRNLGAEAASVSLFVICASP